MKKIKILRIITRLNIGVPPDFKFFCMNGKVQLIQVDIDRYTDHKRNLYDRNFSKLDATLIYPSGYDIEKPKLLNDAIVISEQLSRQFDFIRVDLYLVKNKIIFGELTFCPSTGYGRFTPDEFDFDLGEKLNLPLKY